MEMGASKEDQEEKPRKGKAKEEEPMTTISYHRFGDPSQSNRLKLSILEVMKEEYGLYTWPCSLVLAEYVWQQRARFAGSNVLELGAGTALPGVVAAKVGAHVTLTDHADKLEVFENMQRICQQNHVECKIQGLNWGEWDSNSVNLNPDIILGADTLYDNKATKDTMDLKVSHL